MHHFGLFSKLLLLAIAALLSACASDPVLENGVLINDPYEANNRRTHAFNKALDSKLIGPVARAAKGDDDGGSKQSGQVGLTDAVVNIGANLALPVKVVNSLLQARPVPAARNTARFMINSTLGLGGIFDPAGMEFDLTETDTDFGETLAVWGVPEGAYLEIPVLGPSTQRDSVGRIVDLVIDPFYSSTALSTGQKITVFVLRAASKAGDRARFGDTVDSVLQESADSYAQLRLIYLMHRRHDVGEEGAALDPYAETGADAGVIDPYEDF